MLQLKKLETDLHAGRISRREFMQAAAALGLAAIAPGMVSTAQAAPKRGGRLRAAVTGGATSDSLDPGAILDLYMISVQFGQLRNGLTEVKADGSLAPELAKSWKASSDGKTWTFKIRKGVEFHNGRTLNSEDVVDSINHHRGEGSTSGAFGLLTAIKSVKKRGKDTVEIKLDSANADFPFILSDYHLGICPSNGNGTIDWQSGVGTGGYILVENNPGVRTLTRRNPNYWKSGHAHFDENETLQIADVNSRTNALRTGSVDCMSGVEVKTVDRLKRIPGIDIGVTTGNKQCTLPMHTDVAPFSDNNVRNAIKYAVDREQWLKKIAFGYGELGNDNPIGPANYYRATEDELPQRPYDPDRAKYYLKKAGLSKLSVKLHAAETAFGGAVDAAQLLRESALPTGLDIEVVREPDDGYWSNVWRKEPFSACFWSGRPTEDLMFSTAYAAGADWNDTNWEHAKFNKLLVAGRAELNERKRREIYVEMQQIVHNHGGVILPIFTSNIHARTNKVKTPKVIGNIWQLDSGKYGERWWFA